MSQEDQLRAALARLEKATEKTINTRGYVRDAKSLKALEEMIREQLIHANSSRNSRLIR